MLMFIIQFTKMLLVIQGIADVDGKTSQAEVAKAVDFSYNAVQGSKPEEPKQNGINGTASRPTDGKGKEWEDVKNDVLYPDEQRVLKMVNDTFQDYFTVDAFDGMGANLKQGSLGLVKSAPANQNQPAVQPKVEAQPVIDHDLEKQPIVEHKYVAETLQT